jgi:hypothetical protein
VRSKDRDSHARGSLKVWITVVVAAVLAGGVATGLALDGLAGRLPMRTLPATHGLEYALAAAVNGSHVWVINQAPNGDGSVSELNAANGSWIRTLSHERYGFRYPVAIAADGAHIWIANDPQSGDGRTPKPGDGSVTELKASDGSWIRTLSGGSYGFDFPAAIAISGTHLWVANISGDSVTELNAGDGSWIQTLSGTRYGFSGPDAIMVSAGHLWVANQGESDNGGSVTELNASDGRWIRTVSGVRYGFDDPSAIAAAGNHLWVTNLFPDGNGGSVTELDASDGNWVQTLSGGCYNFDSPAAVAVAGNHLWVTNSHIDQTGGSVTELNAVDGSWIRTLTNDSWPLTLLHSGCIHGTLSSGSYPFTNSMMVTGAGTHIWIFSGRSITVVTDG